MPNLRFPHYFDASVLNSGPLPPPALPGFSSTTGLSATLKAPGPSLTGVRLMIPHHVKGLPVLRALPVCTCSRYYPGTATGCLIRALFPSHISLPRNGGQVGLCNVLFEACSAFTHVRACTLALSPIRDTLHRRLQPLRYLHNCSGCFRLERLPGGTFTHRKAPPCHGARHKRS